MLLKWNYRVLNWFNRKFLFISPCLSGLALLFCCSALYAETDPLLEQIQLLDNEFTVLSAKFYLDTGNYTAASASVISDIDTLSKTVTTLVGNNRSTEAIQLIQHNLATLERNRHHQSILIFIALLLEHNELNLAKTLQQIVIDENDDFLLASTRFIFANYHAERFEWQQVNQLLENVPAKLTAENSAYAYLLSGIALQHLKLHRLAVESFKKIPSASPYYQHAQLNTAIAQIRQGWLTSAKTTITTLLVNADKSNELTNRLLVVLGYAFLQKNYYRNARDIFREVSQDSEYANRALLGIALCAINMEDYAGGLNSLTLLKKKDPPDLFTDESYLLIPYVFERMQQELNITASSTEAMIYYQKRLTGLKNITQKHIDLSQLKFNINAAVFTIQNQTLEYKERFPKSFLQNFYQLLDFSTLNNNPALAKEIESLILLHDRMLQACIDDLVQQKISYLNSYLSQVRYGLARLYDQSKQAVQ